MLWSKAGLIASLLCVLPAGCAAAVRSAASIEREIKAGGADSVVKRLTAAKGDWDTVVRQVETGKDAWLNVASELLGATDAGNTESLHYALSIALTRNAAGVLRLLGPNAPLEKVCKVPYIEPGPGVVAEYRAKARAALAKVRESGLGARKRDCLSGIGESK
jgi:hypothetical protein